MKRLFALAIMGALAASPVSAKTVTLPGGSATSKDTATENQTELIQTELQRAGFYNGPIDGVYGQQTAQALANWQRSRGLPPTGRLDTETINRLGLTEYPPRAVEQQAQAPEEPKRGEIERFREEHMSSPNVAGERIQENTTGVPAPAGQIAPEPGLD